MHSRARLHYTNYAGHEMLCLGGTGVTSSRQQCHRGLQQNRTYAGIAELTTGSEIQASIAQNLPFRPQFPAVRTHATAYWRHIDLWKDVTEEEFLSYRWQASR